MWLFDLFKNKQKNKETLQPSSTISGTPVVLEFNPKFISSNTPTPLFGSSTITSENTAYYSEGLKSKYTSSMITTDDDLVLINTVLMEDSFHQQNYVDNQDIKDMHEFHFDGGSSGGAGASGDWNDSVSEPSYDTISTLDTSTYDCGSSSDGGSSSCD